MEEIKENLRSTVKALYDIEVDLELTRPDEQFGDFSTNVALQLSKQLGKNPREIAEELAQKLRSVQEPSLEITDVSVAGPGFLNLTLSDKALLDSLNVESTRTLEGKTVVAEYSDPNPFKVLHAGHLYTSIVGDAIANLLEHAGGNVHRVNFGGDVGLHVGRTMWAILRELGGENPEGLAAIPEAERSEWMAKQYVVGTNAYEEDEAAKAEIIAINKRVYQLHTDADHDSPFAQIYWTCRQWSYDYFNAFYARIGSHFEKYYPESQTAPIGLAIVKEQLAKGVFTESDGAVVFMGEPYGLHTRVFINSAGLPTYEAKDVGLSIEKWQDYHPDLSVISTGNDIVEYMKVVMKAIEQFEPELAHVTKHLTHGNVKLAGGVKMSSRKGNFLRAVDVLDVATEAAKQLSENPVSEELVLAAVKYAFLKNRIGGDIVYDPVESVSLEGNSGPYLQYAHARAKSILAKSSDSRHAEQPHLGWARVSAPPDLAADVSVTSRGVLKLVQDDGGLEAGERSLVRKLSEYSEVVDRAVAELMPHHICTYLYELAQTFNRFYEHNRVIGDPREAIRLDLVSRYADTLKDGLTLLGITAPERM